MSATWSHYYCLVLLFALFTPDNVQLLPFQHGLTEIDNLQDATYSIGSYDQGMAGHVQ